MITSLKARIRLLCLATGLLVLASALAYAAPFDGSAAIGTYDYGLYYIITGGKLAPGQTVNGTRTSGGSMKYITDEAAWGKAIDTWNTDGWYADNAGFALTLKNGNTTVFDNNGIEDGTYGDYYTEGGSHSTHGLNRGFSMSNNWDWIYAGYFKLDQATTFDSITGYFDANGGAADPVAFNPAQAGINFRMNIWSNVDGQVKPVNTNSFDGDVLCTDSLAGSFSWSDTGVQQTYLSGSTSPIYRLTYTPNAPITLQAGTYWFSHDVTVPEPCSIFALLSGLAGLGIIRRRK